MYYTTRVALASLSLLCCVASINGAAQTQGWIFPGACGASDTYHQYQIDVLKPQWFDIDSSGAVQLGIYEGSCNGYSTSSVADVKAYSKQQFATVSCHYDAMVALVHSTDKVNKAVTSFLKTLKEANITGLEIDCEEYEQWTADDATAFKQFITQLGNSLHQNGFQLMIDGPAIDTQDTQGGVANFKYEDYNNLPVDYIAVMAYDYYLGDGGIGAPVSPDDWLNNTINWTKNKVTSLDKIVVGIGSYGYYGKTSGGTSTQVTKKDMMGYTGYSTATRGASSLEMSWTNSGTFYDYCDTVTLDHRKALVEAHGIKHISVWHLGGNDWFTTSTSPTSAPPSPTSAPPSPTSSPSTSSPTSAPSTSSPSTSAPPSPTSVPSTSSPSSPTTRPSSPTVAPSSSPTAAPNTTSSPTAAPSPTARGTTGESVLTSSTEKVAAMMMVVMMMVMLTLV